MRLGLALVVALALLTGCTARGGQDPWAYTKKSLYSGNIHVDALTPDGTTQTMFVEDGSISTIHAYVWMNMTSGGAVVDFVNPSGETVWSPSATGAQSLPMELGAWKIHVRPLGDGAAGVVGLKVTR